MLLERGAQPTGTEMAVGGPQAKAAPELVEVVHPVRLHVSKSPFTHAPQISAFKKVEKTIKMKTKILRQGFLETKKLNEKSIRFNLVGHIFFIENRFMPRKSKDTETSPVNHKIGKYS